MRLKIAAENGVLENIQVLVLLIATGVFWLRSYAHYKNDAVVLLPYGLFVSTFTFIGAGRKLSFGAVHGADAQGAFIFQVLMAFAVGLVIVSALWMFLRSAEPKIAAIRGYLTHPTSLLIYLAILVSGVSSVFEHGSFQIPASVVIEEIAELLAFVILLRAAWDLEPIDRQFSQSRQWCPM